MQVLVQVKAFIPVGVQRPLRHCGGLGLLAVDGSHGKRIREACAMILH